MLNHVHIRKVLLLLLVLPLFFCTSFAKVSTATLPAGSSKPGSIKLGTKEDYPKEQKSREPVVVVDPGHGGDEWGTYYGDIIEKNLNLDISLRLGELLKQEGIKTVFTREKDVYVGLKERAEFANNLDAALFISVHNNRMPDNPDYKGTETLYCPSDEPVPGKMDGKRLAEIVQHELVKTLQTVDNGIIYRPNLAVLHRTKMPAVIAEVAYVSNWSDRSKLDSAAFRQKAAEALSRAVLEALGEMGAVRSEDGKWVIH